MSEGHAKREDEGQRGRMRATNFSSFSATSLREDKGLRMRANKGGLMRVIWFVMQNRVIE
jgi:hypothetical protein